MGEPTAVVDSREGERGAALLMVISLVLILAGVTAAVLVAARTETLIASAFRQARETLYAAEGVLAIAVDDLARAPDWNAVLTGAASASFTDGAAIGSRTLPGGGTVLLCCGDASLTAEVQQRAFGGADWGGDTPQWQLFGWGPVGSWLPALRVDSVIYAAVWVADDPDDGDANPWIDANGILVLHAQALGPAGSRRIVEATVRRPAGADEETPAPGLKLVSWHEIKW